MEYNRLGDNQLSAIGFGCEPLGGTDWGKFDLGQIEKALHYAIDQGVNFFDTAAVYGLGASEINLAKALGSRKHDVIISTKIGMLWDQPVGARANVRIDNSKQALKNGIENSLKNLAVDQIPLLFIHNYDPKTSAAELSDTLAEFKASGLCKYIGLSNFPLAQLKLMVEQGQVDAVQILFNIAEHTSETISYLDYCATNNIAVTVYGALNRGLFTGKYNRASSFSSDDRRARLPDFKGEELEYRLQILDQLKQIASKQQASTASIAIRWILDHPQISSTILGIKSTEQVLSNLESLGWQLDQMDFEILANANAQ